MPAYRSNKIGTAIEIVQKIRNWPEALGLRIFKGADRLSLLAFRDGFNIVVRGGTRDWDVVHELFFAKGYQKEMQWLAARPDPAPKILDLGGNIGSFTLLAYRNKPGARITAFEPGPPNIALFQMNMLANRLPEDRIELRKMAVAGTTGTATWFFDSANPGGSSLYEKKGEPVDVQIVALAQVIEEAGEDIALLKIDIEGSEYDLLAHTPASVWERVHAIALELHDDPAGKKTQQSFMEEMKAFGYQIEQESVVSYFLHR